MAGLGFTFGAKDSGVGKFFDGLKTSVSSAADKLRSFASGASSTVSGMGGAQAQMKGLNDQVKIFNTEAYNAAKAAEEFTDATAPKRIDPGRNSIGQFTKNLWGMNQAQKEAARNTEQYTSILGRLDKMISQMKFSNLLSLGNLMTKPLSNLGSALKQAGTLTTPLEATFAGLANSAKASAANLGYTGAALTKVIGQASGIAYNLDIDAGAAAKAIYNYNWASKEFASVGIKNANNLAEFSKTSGIEAGAFASQLRGLSKTYDFAAKDMATFVGGLQHFGTESGDIAGALQSMPKIMEVLGNVVDATGKKLTGAPLAEFARGVTAVATAGYAVYQDGPKAMEAAVGLAQALAKSRAEFGRMTTVGGEFPEMLKELAPATGDMSSSFALMQKGPDEFMKGMLEVAVKVKAAGGDVNHNLQIIRDRMIKALGPEQADMITRLFDKADSSMLKNMETAKKATASLGAYGHDGAVPIRTLAEQMERAKDAFNTSFMNISTGRQDFVKNTVKQMGEVQATMKGLSGTAKAFGGVFADVAGIGGIGLLPEKLQPLASILGDVLKNLAPLGAVIAALTIGFGPLGAAVGIAFGAMLVFAKIAEKVKKQMDPLGKGTVSWGDVFTKMANDVAGWVGKIPGLLTKGLAQLDKFLTDFVSSFGDVKMGGAMTKIGDSLKESWGIVWTRIKEFASQFWKGLTGSFQPGEEGASTATGKMAAGLGEALRGAIVSAKNWIVTTGWPMLQGFATDVWKGLSDSMDPAKSGDTQASMGGQLGSLIGGALDTVKTFLEGYFTKWWADVSAIWSKPGGTFKDNLKETFGESKGIIAGAFAIGAVVGFDKVLGGVSLAVKGVGLAFDVVGLAAKAWGAGMELVSAITKSWTVVTEIASLVANGFGAAITFMTGPIGLVILAIAALGVALYAIYKFWPEITAAAKKAWGWIADKWGEFEPTFLAMTSKVGDFFYDLWNGVKKAFKVAWDFIVAAAGLAWAAIKFVFSMYVGFYVAIFTAVFDAAVWVWDLIKGTFSAAWTYIKTVFAGAGEWFAGIWEGIKVKSAEAWDGIKTKVAEIWEGIKSLWGGATAWFETLFTGIKDKVTGIWTDIKNVIVGVWDNHIKPIWNNFAGFFEKMMGGVKDMIKQVFDFFGSVFSAIGGPAAAAFNGVKDAADKIFGNSINTVVAVDMEKSGAEVAGFGKSFDQTMAGIQKTADGTFGHSVNTIVGASLTDTATSWSANLLIMAKATADFFTMMVDGAKVMQAGLTLAFSTTFQQLTALYAAFGKKTTDEFLTPFSESWKNWVAKLVSVFTDGLMFILDSFSLATKSMKTDAAGVMIEVAKMTTALQQLNALKAGQAMENAKANQAQTAAATKDMKMSQDLLVLRDTIDMPLWYKDYKKDVGQLIGLLQTANATKGGAVQSGSTASSAASASIARGYGGKP